MKGPSSFPGPISRILTTLAVSCRRKLSHFLVAQGTNHLYDSRGIVARNGQSSRQPASLHFCRPSHLCPFFWLGKKANVLLRLSGWKGPLWASRVVYFVKIWQKIEWAPVHFPRLFCEFWAFLSEDEKRGKIQAWMGFSLSLHRERVHFCDVVC